MTFSPGCHIADTGFLDSLDGRRLVLHQPYGCSYSTINERGQFKVYVKAILVQGTPIFGREVAYQKLTELQTQRKTVEGSSV